jgi:hydroxyacylglutathione hydrolase
MAAQRHDSLKSKLLVLPNELEVYRGYRAGSTCGAGLSGKPASTIGFEEGSNAMLSMTRDGFIDAVTAAFPPRPAHAARMLAANLDGVGTSAPARSTWRRRPSNTEGPTAPSTSSRTA